MVTFWVLSKYNPFKWHEISRREYSFETVHLMCHKLFSNSSQKLTCHYCPSLSSVAFLTVRLVSGSVQITVLMVLLVGCLKKKKSVWEKPRV